MTGLARKIRRARCRKNGIEIELNPQVYVIQRNGGMRVYHPTKRWRRVSPKRLKHSPYWRFVA